MTRSDTENVAMPVTEMIRSIATLRLAAARIPIPMDSGTAMSAVTADRKRVFESRQETKALISRPFAHECPKLPSKKNIQYILLKNT